MRIILSSALALIVATPAVAQHRHVSPQRPSAEQVGAALSNPAVQDGVAQVVAGVADAVMATHVGPLAQFADPYDDIRPTDTLGDLQARRDPYYRERLQDNTRRSVALAGRAARDAGAMSAELAATAARLRAALGPAVAALDSARDDYDDPY